MALDSAPILKWTMSDLGVTFESNGCTALTLTLRFRSGTCVLRHVCCALRFTQSDDLHGRYLILVKSSSLGVWSNRIRSRLEKE